MSRTFRSMFSFLLSATVALTAVLLTSSTALAQQPADEQAADEEPADEEPAGEEPAGEEPADEPSAEEELEPPPPPLPDGPSDVSVDDQRQDDPIQDDQIRDDQRQDDSIQDDQRQDAQSQQDDPAGWSLLSRAAEQLARGKKQSARRLLERLAREYPTHPATTVSADALAVLSRDRAGKIDPSAQEERTGLARAELAFFQTAHGIVLGTELCVMMECDDPQSVVLALGAGGGLGLAFSLLPTGDGITSGHALLLNSGTTWGFANGLLGSIALDVDGANAAGMYAASQLGGLGLSALIWDVAKPTAGEVSMANSGGLWVGFLTFLAHGFGDFSSSDEAVSWSVLLGADLGIIGGALLSQRYPMSRGRTFIIDSGGILGFLVGSGTYILTDVEFESASAFSAMSMLGTLAGLGTATYLTRDWDEPEVGFSANWTVAPTDGGAMLSVGGSFE